MDVVRRFLLHAVDAYASRTGTGPTVRELATDLGLPADFGRRHLVDHLRGEVELEHVAHYRGRFTLTGAGRLALDLDEARLRVPRERDVPVAGAAPPTPVS